MIFQTSNVNLKNIIVAPSARINVDNHDKDDGDMD